ncbi:hypothetical protein A9507_11555 [Methanobacterium sp. A39]|nr:hypothetical protein A9507_11555 [Methanobacterium sp. A39]
MYFLNFDYFKFILDLRVLFIFLNCFNPILTAYNVFSDFMAVLMSKIAILMIFIIILPMG